MRALGLIALVLGMSAATGARAADAPSDPPSAGRRALNTAAAVVPGALVHGSGHLAAGDPDTGYALLAAEGVGLGMVLGGGTVLFATGASRYFVGPAAAVTALGVGVFGLSFTADLYGSVSAESGAGALVPRVEAPLESELGYRYVSDPRFEYEHFAVERVSYRSGPLRLTPSAWLATNGENGRYRLEAAYRLIGPVPRRAARLSDELDFVLGALHHRYVTERFDRTGGELAVSTRYDLGHIGPTLRGAFVEFGAGFALASIHYDLRGMNVPNDWDALLLANFGFGVVLRGKAAPGSVARLYYDHRHDDFAGGLLMTGLGSGVAGKFGAELRWYFSERFGLLADAQAGSALTGGLSLLFRDSVPKVRPREQR